MTKEDLETSVELAKSIMRFYDCALGQAYKALSPTANIVEEMFCKLTSTADPR